jgi:phosphate transport system protein
MRSTPHLDQVYESELRALQHQLARTGLRAEGMVRDAVRALLERDMALARSVVAHDEELDLLETETDQLCLKILARHAPVGADLRFVTAALKADIDMERIGDLAVNVAKRTLDIGIQPGLEPVAEIRRLSEGALELVSMALRSLQDRDAAMALAVKARDPQLDDLNRAVFERMIEIAKQDRAEMERALAYTSVARHLERIADHAVNIAEHAVFVVEGRVLRHTGPSGTEADEE